MEEKKTQGQIKVGIRIRPLIQGDILANNVPLWSVSANSVVELDPASKSPRGSGFVFDHVYDSNTSNRQVYDSLAEPVVANAMKGFNGTIFAYGQTASGKTYTMVGDKRNSGVIPLAVQQVFETIEKTPDRQFLLRVSYMEIYQEKISDLLAADKAKLEICEPTQGQVYVKGLTEEVVTSRESIVKLMSTGEKQRHFARTNLNDHSSRSHTIFRIIIESRPLDTETESLEINVSHLNLVDLAGSENADKAGTHGQRLKEGCAINKSLFALGGVISSLSAEKKHHNFRDSKLTRILKSSLGGNAYTAVICTVTPTVVEETRSTFRFALNARRVQNIPHVNKVVPDDALMGSKLREIRELEEKLQGMELQRKIIQEQGEQIRSLEQQLEKCREIIVVSSNTRSKANDSKEDAFRKLRRQTWGFSSTQTSTPFCNLRPRQSIPESPLGTSFTSATIDFGSDFDSCSVFLPSEPQDGTVLGSTWNESHEFSKDEITLQHRQKIFIDASCQTEPFDREMITQSSAGRPLKEENNTKETTRKQSLILNDMNAILQVHMQGQTYKMNEAQSETEDAAWKFLGEQLHVTAPTKINEENKNLNLATQMMEEVSKDAKYLKCQLEQLQDILSSEHSDVACESAPETETQSDEVLVEANKALTEQLDAAASRICLLEAEKTQMLQEALSREDRMNLSRLVADDLGAKYQKLAERLRKYETHEGEPRPEFDVRMWDRLREENDCMKKNGSHLQEQLKAAQTKHVGVEEEVAVVEEMIKQLHAKSHVVAMQKQITCVEVAQKENPVFCSSLQLRLYKLRPLLERTKKLVVALNKRFEEDRQEFATNSMRAADASVKHIEEAAFWEADCKKWQCEHKKAVHEIARLKSELESADRKRRGKSVSSLCHQRTGICGRDENQSPFLPERHEMEQHVRAVEKKPSPTNVKFPHGVLEDCQRANVCTKTAGNAKWCPSDSVFDSGDCDDPKEQNVLFPLTREAARQQELERQLQLLEEKVSKKKWSKFTTRM